MDLIRERDSWLDSRPLWSLGQSAPFRPTSTSANMAIDIARAPRDGSPINLLAKFLRMKVTFELEEISFPFGNSTGIKIGEGTTYIVEKRLLPNDEVKQSEREWVAVKRSKSIVPKDPNKAFAMPSDSLRRLKAILLEIEVMFHPPLRSHPNIARLLGFSWDYDAPGYTPLLVMELASHGTLAEFLPAEDTTSQERRQLCLDVTLGLEVLHNSMIVHGDVKQDNVLVFPHSSRRFIAKLSDFGLALLGDDEPVYRGTPIYNAPEIHLHSLQNNHRNFTVSTDSPSDLFIKCDAFSFGVLCFEIFIGGEQYYRIPDTEPFRKMLFAGAPDDALFIKQAMELSCNPLVPIDLITDCRSIFESTLSPSPTLRLRNGWDDVKRILGMLPPDESKEPSDIAQSLRRNISERPSMLEFHYEATFGGDLLEALISELKFFAESSDNREERAQAAFDLCLLSTITIASGIFVEDAALDWLMKAQLYRHEMACRLVPRIFGACQYPIPRQISTKASSDTTIEEHMSRDVAINWYAEAVRVHWGRSIRAKIVRDLQYLVFHEQVTELHERLMESSQDAKFLESTESRFLIHLAVANSNPDVLQRVLDHGANIDECTPSGETALHIASMMGDLEVVRLLVQRGADGSINDSRNISPIHWLVLFPSSDTDEAAELLLHARANVESYVNSTHLYFDDLGLDLTAGPLYWAAMCRNHSAVSALLRHCEHLNLTNYLLLEDESLSSAVDAALGTVCADTLEIILQHGLLPDKLTAKDKQMCWRKVAYQCSNKFQRWCIHGDHYEAAFVDIVDVLHRYGIEYTDDFDPDITLWTPLIRASISCNSSWARALIRDGADINYRPVDNAGTAMEMAIYSARFIRDIYAVIKFVKLLYESGASMEPPPLHPNSSHSALYATSQYRQGALHLAVRHGAGIPLIQYLLQQVPEQVNQKYEGQPLLNKVFSVYEEADACRATSLLLAAGADSSAESDHLEGQKWNCCQSAAATAIQSSDWKALKLLLDHGSTLNFGVSGAHQRSILHQALRLSLRCEHGILLDDIQVRRQRLEVIDLLLSHPISARDDLVNRPTSDGISPLMNAAIWGLPTHVATLLHHGADVYYQFQGNSVFQFIDLSRESEIKLPFVVDDEIFEEHDRVSALETHISKVKRSEYLRRLDEIESLLRHWVVSNEEHDSAVARNTNSQRRLLPSTL